MSIHRTLPVVLQCTIIIITAFVCFDTSLESHSFDILFVFLSQDLKKAGVLVYANKQDVKGSMSAAEISQHLNLTSIKDHGWHIQACCALTGEG